MIPSPNRATARRPYSGRAHRAAVAGSIGIRVFSADPTRSGSRPIPKVGDNPLVAAAAPVLAAAIRISGDRNPPDPDRLRTAMVAAIQRFETDALATGLDTRSLRAARYALCATVDDLVLSTPWGSPVELGSAESDQRVPQRGHRRRALLRHPRTECSQTWATHAQVVELMYLCTSLGFEGRYRVMPRGVAALTELREGVYRTLRQHQGRFRTRTVAALARRRDACARRSIRHIPLWARVLGDGMHCRRVLPDVQLHPGRRLRLRFRRVGGSATQPAPVGCPPAGAHPKAGARRLLPLLFPLRAPHGSASSWRRRSAPGSCRSSRTRRRSPSA